MVYYTHATNPITFGTLFVVYYGVIFVAIIAWFWRYYAYIRKGRYHLKQLAAYLIVAFLITSLAGAAIAGKYLYLHSPLEPQFCMTSSCVLSSHPVERYGLNETGLKEAGIPKLGPMWVYIVYDRGVRNEVIMEKELRALVIVRPLLLVPVVEVSVYHFSGENVTGKRSSTYYGPSSRGRFSPNSSISGSQSS